MQSSGGGGGVMDITIPEGAGPSRLSHLGEMNDRVPSFVLLKSLVLK